MNSSTDSLFTTYIGNLEDVFYQYANDRKNETVQLLDLQKKVLKIDSFAPLTDKLVSLVKFISSAKNDEFNNIVKQFAKGSGLKTIDVKLLSYLPDYLASYYHFNPELMSYIPGCSSLLYQDQNGDNQHLRILDYSLTNFFTKYEEIIRFKVDNYYSFISVGVKGFPLPFYTLVNEQGLTLALHQRISAKFYPTGENIFSIMFTLAGKAKNIIEVKEILKQTQSLTSWGIVAMDSSGSVLHAELGGEDHQFEVFNLTKDKFLYFNREPLKKDTCPLESLTELSVKQARYIKNSFKTFKKKAANANELFINMTDHFNEMPLENNLLTISTVQAVQFNPKKNELIFKSGLAPKIDGQYHYLKDLFHDTQEEILDKAEEDHSISQFNLGMQKISKAQFFYDTGEKEKALHEIQMAMTLIEEGPLFVVAKFNFLIWQYISFNNKKDLMALYDEMQKLNHELPQKLSDHAKLFIMRIEKICGLELSIKRDQLTSQNLQKLYDKEIKLKPSVLRVLKYLIFPRLELFDIIYLY